MKPARQEVLHYPSLLLKVHHYTWFLWKNLLPNLLNNSSTKPKEMVSRRGALAALRNLNKQSKALRCLSWFRHPTPVGVLPYRRWLLKNSWRVAGIRSHCCCCRQIRCPKLWPASHLLCEEKCWLQWCRHVKIQALHSRLRSRAWQPQVLLQQVWDYNVVYVPFMTVPARASCQSSTFLKVTFWQPKVIKW